MNLFERALPATIAKAPRAWKVICIRMPAKNRYLEAVKENYNAIGMAAATALSLVLLNPLPLLAGIVAEVGYLLVVPDSKWYAARLATRSEADAELQRQKLKQQTLPTLFPEQQARFQRLEAMRAQIDTQSQDNKTWFREVLRKLDYLLEKFLVFAAKEMQFRTYLQSLSEEVRAARHTGNASGFDLSDAPEEPRNPAWARSGSNPELKIVNNAPAPGSGDRWVQQTVEEVQNHYDQERQGVEQLMETEQDFDTKAVLEKRADVLRRRHEFAGKIGKILLNINHQLQLVEDTFGLINDEIRARSPDQILADIEEVVIATDSMSTTLEELAPYEQLAARISA